MIGETSAFVHPESMHHRFALMRLVVPRSAYQRNAKQVLDDRQETDPVGSDPSLQFPTNVADGIVCAQPMMARCTVTVFSRLLVLETNDLSPHSAGMQNFAPPTS